MKNSVFSLILLTAFSVCHLKAAHHTSRKAIAAYKQSHSVTKDTQAEATFLLQQGFNENNCDIVTKALQAGAIVSPTLLLTGIIHKDEQLLLLIARHSDQNTVWEAVKQAQAAKKLRLKNALQTIARKSSPSANE